jgi:hypothetical protein
VGQPRLLDAVGSSEIERLVAQGVGHAGQSAERA